MNAVTLHRIDAARNMARFYALDVQPDLFGGVALVKQWGRIGARGRVSSEHHADEASALDALEKQAERKRRRGYASPETADIAPSGEQPCISFSSKTLSATA